MNLSVFLIEGANVPKCDLIGASDPYCVFNISGSSDTQHSKYIDDSTTPVWNESFTFFVSDPKTQKLEVKMVDKDIMFNDDIASCTIDLSTLVPHESCEKWYNLTCVKGISGVPKIHMVLTLD